MPMGTDKKSSNKSLFSVAKGQEKEEPSKKENI